MIFQGKFITGFLILLSFILGILLDRCFKNFPYLELDPKVGVLDLATLLITIAIAFMIPIFVTKIIEDKKGIKIFFVDEVKELIFILSEIKKVISDAHGLGEFKPTDRDKINYIFHTAELKIVSIREQVEIAFKNKAEETGTALVDSLFEYKDYLTGGELMLSTFVKVDERFYKENNTHYSKLETKLKTLTQKIYKF